MSEKAPQPDVGYERLAAVLERAVVGVTGAVDMTTAGILIVRAAVALLEERGLLAPGEVRERALALTEALPAGPADVEAAVRRMLPDPGEAPEAAVPVRLN